MEDKHTKRTYVHTGITREEMENATDERMYEIGREFNQGFKFLKDYPRSVTFFGSTQFTEEDPYYKSAYELAKRIVTDLSYTVVTGGGPGIMEAANRGALDANGNSIGLTIRLPKEQVMNKYMTNHVDFYYFFSRKVCLAYSAEAFVFFPGGFGTLDEFFEIVTLLQTKKIQKVPVILVGSDFWNEVLELLKKSLLSRGTIDESDLHIFTITDNVDEILSIIKEAPVQEHVPYNGIRVNPINE